jgi:hypothetical protein
VKFSIQLQNFFEIYAARDPRSAAGMEYFKMFCCEKENEVA